MKRFLSTFFITLALIVGVAGAAPATHADDIECTDSNLGQACAVDGRSGMCVREENEGIICSERVSATASIDQAAEKTAKGYEPEKSTDSVLAGVMQSIMKLFAWLVGVAALTLDYAVFYTVVKMGDYVNNLSAVGVTWQIMRDIGNIVIIFGFLAIGISTILNTERIGYGKKMLPMLLVAAVFLNFSLFLTEAVIDTGNLFATQFYTQIKGGQLPTAESLSGKGVLDAVEKEGISNKIMGQLGLQTIYTAGRVNTKVFESGNSLIIGFMGIILFLVTAFVLFSLAFVLIARFVILLFLIIVAPIGFAGLAVPQLKGTADKWWHWLFEQTITAPVLLLLLYIALAVITDAQFMAGFGSKSDPNVWTGFVANDNLAGFGSVMISFLVAMGLLLAVVIISKKMSAFGADKASALAGKLSFGATAWGMRTSGGWLANKTARGLRKIGVGNVPLVGTGLVRGFDRLATSSFDMRGIKMAGGLKGIGIEVGEAQKGGYKADLKARTESRTKYAGELVGFELSDEKKAEQAALQNEVKKLQKGRGRATSVAEIQKIDADIKKTEGKLAEIEKWTDKGQQRSYAKALNLWSDEKNFFNKYINFAANTDAAKIIRAGAKKAKPDKDWTANMKKLLEETAKETVEEEGAGTGTTTPPPAAAPTPPPSPAAPSSGGTTSTQ